MGYEKTYDALYHQQSLAIFRKDEVWPFRGENSSQSQKKEQNQESPSKNDTQGYSGEPQAKTLDKFGQGGQNVQPQEGENGDAKKHLKLVQDKIKRKVVLNLRTMLKADGGPIIPAHSRRKQRGKVSLKPAEVARKICKFLVCWF